MTGARFEALEIGPYSIPSTAWFRFTREQALALWTV